ncbi:DMT family transporter [Pseudohalocynthiibacter aestuariivivens]|jgi:drug/metabolite transporter (DMT)-like permease|uniref:DMT family transporter n=1 Tax=Pseudohalocynthiibacter aestuariivivens TaxID=1591409 RepID=A0ABV5JC62_9RHOB|nr:MULTISPECIES: DMT family transporter [Pseudohalocynthiibacter]MBS9715965.1 DMT family transporter [Pseudohalocynthiibacter aestuariivivens]MCK0102478.1 DMT family transporter [Pseudohalocynthiibacter sp. F2068]
MQLHPPTPGFASGAVFVSASAWGLYWIPLRYLENQGVDGTWAIALLNFPAACALAVVVLLQWRSHKESLGKAAAIGALAGFGLALYASGLVYSSVVRATLLFYLTPVWATLIGMVWLGEKASWQRWAAILGGLAGLVLLVSGGGSVPFNIGDVFALFSGVFWALGAAMIMRFDAVPLPGMTMFQFAFTTLGALVLGYSVSIVDIPHPDLANRLIPFASMISVFAILPAVVVLFWAQKFLFPGRVGLLMMSEVLVAVITASLFLPEEHMSPIEWLGAVLIIGACLFEVLLTPRENF